MTSKLILVAIFLVSYLAALGDAFLPALRRGHHETALGVGATWDSGTMFSPEERTQTLNVPKIGQVTTSHVVEQIESTSDLCDFMSGAKGEDLTVIKYYANYCKICQRTGIQFKKISGEYPNVRFGKVESHVFPNTVATLKSLGVTKFPFIQIYNKGQCVASFSTGPSLIFVKKIRDTIDGCLDRTPEEWAAFTSDIAADIEENQLARQALTPQP